jgi:antitoxin component of MazEF toxin-antitoxin module
MGIELKVRKVGNGFGVLLPKQFLEEAGLEEGALLSLERVGGAYQLKPVDEEFTRQVEAFLRTEPDHRNTYRELAK